MPRPHRIVTVLGTRPEAIKLFPLLHRLDTDSRFESLCLVTGQHRAMLDQVLTTADIRPDRDLAVMRKDQTLDELSARLLTGIGSYLDDVRPNMVVVQGDTSTAMCGALAAYYRKIPISHVEAGLRSGDLYQPWPEEGNRRIIGTLAALHCAPTESSARALYRENIAPDRVRVTGNTVVDALHWITARIEKDASLASGLAAFEEKFRGRRIIGITSHRRENFGEGMRAIARAIRRLAGRSDVAMIFPVHLNPNVRDLMRTELGGLDNVALMDPLDYPHFARLVAISTLMLTDSGGVQEEAPALGKPVLVMRETTERPEGIEAGTAKLVGTDEEAIVRETERLLDDPSAYNAMARAHNPYGDGNSSARIAEHMASFLG